MLGICTLYFASEHFCSFRCTCPLALLVLDAFVPCWRWGDSALFGSRFRVLVSVESSFLTLCNHWCFVCLHLCPSWILVEHVFFVAISIRHFSLICIPLQSDSGEPPAIERCNFLVFVYFIGFAMASPSAADPCPMFIALSLQIIGIFANGYWCFCGLDLSCVWHARCLHFGVPGDPGTILRHWAQERFLLDRNALSAESWASHSFAMWFQIPRKVDSEIIPQFMLEHRESSVVFAAAHPRGRRICALFAAYRSGARLLLHLGKIGAILYLVLDLLSVLSWATNFRFLF